MTDSNDFIVDFFAPRNTNETQRRCENCHYWTAAGEAGNRWRGNCQNVEGMAWCDSEDYCSKWQKRKQ